MLETGNLIIGRGRLDGPRQVLFNLCDARTVTRGPAEFLRDLHFHISQPDTLGGPSAATNSASQLSASLKNLLRPNYIPESALREGHTPDTSAMQDLQEVSERSLSS